MNPTDFVAAIRIPVRQALPAAIGMARAMVVAHAAHESGWGTTKAFVRGNNLFGICRDARDSKSPIVEAPDLEYGPDGTAKPITQKFLAFEHHRACVEYYLKFIARRRYQPALTELLDGNTKFIATLGKGGFYTLPAAAYMSRYLIELRAVEEALEAITQV